MRRDQQGVAANLRDETPVSTTLPQFLLMVIAAWLHRQRQRPRGIGAADCGRRGVLCCIGDNSPNDHAMARLTITLSAERHRALREAAVQRGKTIGQLIEESLDFYGIKSARSAEALVARARARSGLTEKQALRLAVAETRAARRR